MATRNASDIVAAMDAIRAQTERGALSDQLVFDAVRIRLTCALGLRSGESCERSLPPRVTIWDPRFSGP